MWVKICEEVINCVLKWYIVTEVGGGDLIREIFMEGIGKRVEKD